MKPAPGDTTRRHIDDGRPQRGGLVGGSSPWLRFPRLPLALIALFLAFVFLPRVQVNPRLVWTFLGVGAALLVWVSMLRAAAKRRGRHLGIEGTTVLKSHYIQASVQLCIYAYWGWYWPAVYAEAPLILAQLVFLYAFDALLTWSRGRNWRLGFGPLPIVLSTNVFIWFKDDWYVFQFLLVAVGALGKEFIKWRREGKTTHIFNPSAFTLSLFSIVLIATGTTHTTWGIEVAATLGNPPHIYLQIFLLGLIVQYFFSVTLMTLSATAVLCVLNQIYFEITGTYFFVDTNIPVAIFLGLHLLVTDPSTSPRTNVGRVIFGGLYGLGNFVLYWILGRFGVPDFYDKLLPVPFLNLSVQAFDRVANSGIIGRFSQWERTFRPRRLNLVHMGCWVALCIAMLGTGYLEGPHKGSSIAFWKKAYAQGKPDAGQKLFKVVGAQAERGSGPACNELGMIYLEGKLAEKSRAAAAHYFATACESGDPGGCANVANQFLFLREARSDKDVARALQQLEQDCGQGTDGRSCHLIGFAYETGRGRPLDEGRARALYEEGCRRGNLDACKGLASIRVSGDGGSGVLAEAARVLEKACESGDAESCLYLAYLYHDGNGVRRDERRARNLLEVACRLGSRRACDAAEQMGLPPLSALRSMVMPRWWASVHAVGG